MRARYRMPDDELLVGFVGSFGPWHGAPVLADEAIEIASKHPTAWWGTIEVRPIAGNHCGDADLG